MFFLFAELHVEVNLNKSAKHKLSVTLTLIRAIQKKILFYNIYNKIYDSIKNIIEKLDSYYYKFESIIKISKSVQYQYNLTITRYQ